MMSDPDDPDRRCRPSQPNDPPQPPWHSLPLTAILKQLGTDPCQGLPRGEDRKRLARYGRNILAEIRTRSRWQILADQFKNLPVVMLLVATVIAYSIGRHLEASALLAVILLTAALGFIMEAKAEQSMLALRRLAVPLARVIHGGKAREIPALDLVPGDLIELEAGDRVPSDARIVEAADLLVDESPRTGESHGVAKDEAAVLPEDTPLAERQNLLYLGTTLQEGRVEAIVTATGMRTQVGHISQLIEAAGGETTPLERRLAHLGRWLIVVVLVLAAIYIGAGLVLAIAAVPESLPTVATIALAVGMQTWRAGCRRSKRSA